MRQVLVIPHKVGVLTTKAIQIETEVALIAKNRGAMAMEIAQNIKRNMEGRTLKVVVLLMTIKHTRQVTEAHMTLENEDMDPDTTLVDMIHVMIRVMTD
jgi:hypothetical protein